MIHSQPQGITSATNDLTQTCINDCSIKYNELIIMWGKGDFPPNAPTHPTLNLAAVYQEAQEYGSAYKDGIIYIDQDSFMSNEYNELIEEYIEVYNHQFIKYHNPISKNLLIDFTAYHELAHTVDIFNDGSGYNQHKNETFADVMAIMLIASLNTYSKIEILSLIDYISTFRKNYTHINNDNAHDSSNALLLLRPYIANKSIEIFKYNSITSTKNLISSLFAL